MRLQALVVLEVQVAKVLTVVLAMPAVLAVLEVILRRLRMLANSILLATGAAVEMVVVPEGMEVPKTVLATALEMLAVALAVIFLMPLC